MSTDRPFIRPIGQRGSAAALWPQLTDDTEQWLLNQWFLDDAIEHADTIWLIVPINRIEDVTGSLPRELEYLSKTGHDLSADGLSGRAAQKVDQSPLGK